MSVKKRFIAAILVMTFLFNLLPILPVSAESFAVGDGAPDFYTQTAFTIAYESHGGRAKMGYPINKVHRWGNGWIQDFRGGGTDTAIMVANGSTTAYVVWGAIWQKYVSLKGAEGFLGYPTSGEVNITASTGTQGVYQEFQGGRLTWHRNGARANQTFETHGNILGKYKAIGGHNHPMGLPITDELESPRSTVSGASGRYTQCERGILAHFKDGPRAGATFQVSMGIWDLYRTLGLGGWLGYPISDEYPSSGGRKNDFEGGFIYWTQQGGASANRSAPSQSGDESVIDNGGPGFASGGTAGYWHLATVSPDGRSLGYGGSMLWTLCNPNWTDNWARWTPNLGKAGNYEVFAYVPRYYGSTTNAVYKVNHAGKTDIVRIRQAAYFDNWVSLGTFDFSVGQGGNVYLDDNTGEVWQSKWVAFDAIKFVYRSTNSSVGVGDGAPNKAAFLDAFNRHGGQSKMGSPINKVHRWGNGWIQDFRGGGSDTAIMLADGASKAFVVWGGIWQNYKGFGGAERFLRYPTSDEIPAKSSSGVNGVYQEYQGGRITWHSDGPLVGKAFETHGAILDRYRALGGPQSWLGLPVSNEYAWGIYPRSNFEGGYIVYDKKYNGAFERRPNQAYDPEGARPVIPETKLDLLVKALGDFVLFNDVHKLNDSDASYLDKLIAAGSVTITIGTFGQAAVAKATLKVENKAISIEIKQLLKGLDDAVRAGSASKANFLRRILGNVGEKATSLWANRTGLQLARGYSKVSLNAPGIDAIYQYVRYGRTNYVVTEAKYYSKAYLDLGLLSDTKTLGRQMSDKWVRANIANLKDVGLRNTLRKDLDAGRVGKVVVVVNQDKTARILSRGLQDFANTQRITIRQIDVNGRVISTYWPRR